MAGATELKRVEIVFETLELQRLLAVVERAGAAGYTVIPRVHGKGHRGVRRDLGFSNVLKNDMVVIIARADVAEQIVRAAEPLLRRWGGILTVTPVETCVGSAER